MVSICFLDHYSGFNIIPLLKHIKTYNGKTNLFQSVFPSFCLFSIRWCFTFSHQKSFGHRWSVEAKPGPKWTWTVPSRCVYGRLMSTRMGLLYCCCSVLLFSSANSAPKKETLSEDCEAFNTLYHIITHFNIIFILSSYAFASFRFLLCCLKYLEVFRMRSYPSKSSEVSCAASASLAWRGIAQIWPSPSSIWMGITSWAAMSSENYTHFCWDICQPWRILRRNGID